MIMGSSSQGFSKGGDWKGILFMLFLVILSALNVNIMSQSISLLFLPLIGVCLWPRIESPVISIVAVLLFGLLVDVVSAGPLGLWALIFLAVFAIFKPYQRLKPHSFATAFRSWCFVLLLAFLVSYLLGWFALKSRPDILALLLQALTAFLLFPLIYGLQYIGTYLLSDSDMRGL